MPNSDYSSDNVGRKVVQGTVSCQISYKVIHLLLMGYIHFNIWGNMKILANSDAV